MRVKVSLNNETAEIAAGTSLSEAIEQWQLGGKKIAVAVNGEFVPRSDYPLTQLAPGDQIDIVKPVGGG